LGDGWRFALFAIHRCSRFGGDIGVRIEKPIDGSREKKHDCLRGDDLPLIPIPRPRRCVIEAKTETETKAETATEGKGRPTRTLSEPELDLLLWLVNNPKPPDRPAWESCKEMADAAGVSEAQMEKVRGVMPKSRRPKTRHSPG
jgi:hypothetical protein